jgi:hypothetical protein
VCAIDVAKASGKVCIRILEHNRADRRVSRVWDVAATADAVTELADHLIEQGIEKVTVEAPPTIGGSGATCSKRPGSTCSWSTPGK